MALLGRPTLVRDFDLSVPLQLRIRADAITLIVPTLEEIGVLDLKTASVLKPLIKDNPLLEFEVFADHDQLQRTRLGKKASKIIPLCIYIYGPITCSNYVASALSEARVFLQEPIYIRPASTYHNPHFLHFDDIVTPRFLFVSPHSLNFAAEIDAILEQSDVRDVPILVEQDSRVQTKLHKYDLSH